jgi:hypothetical protein
MDIPSSGGWQKLRAAFGECAPKGHGKRRKRAGQCAATESSKLVDQEGRTGVNP